MGYDIPTRTNVLALIGTRGMSTATCTMTRRRVSNDQTVGTSVLTVETNPDGSYNLGHAAGSCSSQCDYNIIFGDITNAVETFRQPGQLCPSGFLSSSGEFRYSAQVDDFARGETGLYEWEGLAGIAAGLAVLLVLLWRGAGLTKLFVKGAAEEDDSDDLKEYYTDSYGRERWFLRKTTRWQD